MPNNEKINPKELMEKMFIDEIEKRHGQVMMDTPYCVEYLLSHDNCRMCQHYIGCHKLSAMQITFLYGAMYKSKDFEDAIKTAKMVSNMLHKILDAKTKEEVDEII